MSQTVTIHDRITQVVPDSTHRGGGGGGAGMDFVRVSTWMVATGKTGGYLTGSDSATYGRGLCHLINSANQDVGRQIDSCLYKYAPEMRLMMIVKGASWELLGLLLVQRDRYDTSGRGTTSQVRPLGPTGNDYRFAGGSSCIDP